MGVPKFYRWLSERYPLINRKIGSDPRFLPHFDNFYLDLNGIIHGCSHPDDTSESVSKIISFEEICANMEVIIDKMVDTVRPRKVLFIAVDGCAPRAKMNQQRSRRFASARDRQRIIQEQKEKSSKSEIQVEKELNASEHFFDSNVITPGTEFMEKLHNYLQQYISKKIETDIVWSKIRVIYSGHNVPGEGEHKIMQFVRSERRKMNYDPNTRHCCNSLDADLIMLGLATHEKRFCLLREEVDFTGGRDEKGSLKTKEFSSLSTDLERWELLDLSTLRQYLSIEFNSFHLKKMQKATWPEKDSIALPDIENIVDDLIVLISIIGNDFLPHLPGIEIANGSLDHIFAYYKEIIYRNFNEGDFNYNYVVLDGHINLENLFKMFETLSLDEEEYFNGSNAKKQKGKPSTISPGSQDLKMYRKKYYTEKFGINFVSGENIGLLSDACFNFMHGIFWCFDYYFVGVSSWEWYYPFHYPPLASDLKSYLNLIRDEDHWNVLGHPLPLLPLPPPMKNSVSDDDNDQILLIPSDDEDDQILNDSDQFELSEGKHKINRLAKLSADPALVAFPDVLKQAIYTQLNTFTLGHPLLPFLQLLCCLPPQSAHALPSAYASLMTADWSPLRKFYPKEFKVDLNGKRYEYEGVNIIPFVDVMEIYKAVAHYLDPNSTRLPQLTPTEIQRNNFGPNLSFHSENQVVKKEIANIPSVVSGIIHHVGGNVNSQLRQINDFTPEGHFEGDSNLFSLNVSHERSGLKELGVNVFGRPSRRETMAINIDLQHEIKTFCTSEIGLVENMNNSEDEGEISARKVARYFNGKMKELKCRKLKCWVNYPYALEGEIVSVYDQDNKYSCRPPHADFKDSIGSFVIDKKYGHNNPLLLANLELVAHRLLDALNFGAKKVGVGGIELDDFLEYDILVEVVPRTGISFDFSKNCFRDIFEGVPVVLPIQIISLNNPARDRKLCSKYWNDELYKQKFLDKALMKQDLFMFLTAEHFGSVGVIRSNSISISQVYYEAENLNNAELMLGRNMVHNCFDKYYGLNDVCNRLGLQRNTIGKITGSVLVNPGRFDIGLNLKVGRKYKVPGFTRPSQHYMSKKEIDMWRSRAQPIDVNGVLDALEAAEKQITKNSNTQNNQYDSTENWRWEYSERAVRLIEQYRHKFPSVFECLEKNPEEYEYSLGEIFGNSGNSYREGEGNGDADFEVAAAEDDDDDLVEEIIPKNLSLKAQLEQIKEFLENVESKNVKLVPVESGVISPEALKGTKAIINQLALQRRIKGERVLDFASLSGEGIKHSMIRNQQWFDSPTKDVVPALGDRVANMCSSAVNFGERGFIIATHPGTKCVEVLFDCRIQKVVKYAQMVNLTQPKHLFSTATLMSTQMQTQMHMTSYKDVSAKRPLMNRKSHLTTRPQRNENVSKEPNQVSSDFSPRSEEIAKLPKMGKGMPVKNLNKDVAAQKTEQLTTMLNLNMRTSLSSHGDAVPPPPSTTPEVGLSRIVGIPVNPTRSAKGPYRIQTNPIKSKPVSEQQNLDMATDNLKEMILEPKSPISADHRQPMPPKQPPYNAVPSQRQQQKQSYGNQAFRPPTQIKREYNVIPKTLTNQSIVERENGLNAILHETQFDAKATGLIPMSAMLNSPPKTKERSDKAATLKAILKVPDPKN